MENICVKDILKATGGKLLCGSENTIVSKMAVDSRKIESGDLYVPIIGEKTDGHLYIDSAFKNGAAAALTGRDMTPRADGKALVRVDDTMEALRNIGHYLRGGMKMAFVGITGSVGKTTTREMTVCALSAVKSVTSTSGNSNSQIGVPLTLSMLDPHADIAVMEFGVSEPGEMSKIASIGRPDIALITNIGVSHIENLGSREGILGEKLHITDGFDEHGTLFVNGDDPLLRNLKGSLPFNVFTYGLSEGCDITASDISAGGAQSSFSVSFPGDMSLAPVRVRLSVPGKHMILNALAALSVCALSGLDLKLCAKKLETFSGFERRLQIKELDGFTLIDDSYNASPDSAKAALDVLGGTGCGGRKIAVLADMLELGENAPLYHRQVGEHAAKVRPDIVITIGELSRNIAEATKAAGIETYICEDNAGATEALRGLIRRGDTVLLKGSNGMKLNEIAKAAEGFKA